MDWIKANWEHILAAVGALYLAALAIVKLTPTPKDDEALAKIATVAKGIAFLFGLKTALPPSQPPKPEAGAGGKDGAAS